MLLIVGSTHTFSAVLFAFAGGRTKHGPDQLNAFPFAGLMHVSSGGYKRRQACRCLLHLNSARLVCHTCSFFPPPAITNSSPLFYHLVNLANMNTQ
jgi:hypothetical protein